jgi:L-histidine Nalpha-methyltransferase
MIANEVQFAYVAQAVDEGFAKKPKRLPSWLFYDEAGDKIFQEIMHSPEYYLTPCEYEILETHKSKLLSYFMADGSSFNLVELGAGDGLKTEILLKHFISQEVDFLYSPIDVSEAVLKTLVQRLKKSVPQLEVQPINKRYNEALENLSTDTKRKVLIFMGANIGNFSMQEAQDFVKSIADGMHSHDQLLIGFDLKKDPHKILAAYNDSQGITSRFNLNLLKRLNRELGANFDTAQFTHYPYYDPATGTTKSFLVSLKAQDVYFELCDKQVHFKQWESIHTEISQKFDFEMINQLAQYAGLQVVDTFQDSKKYFCDVLFECR